MLEFKHRRLLFGDLFSFVCLIPSGIYVDEEKSDLIIEKWKLKLIA